MLTECVALGAGDAPIEFPVSLCFNFALDLEKGLKMSDCSLFTTTGLFADLFPPSLEPSPLGSKAVAA